MLTKEYDIRIQHKRDTHETWVEIDPVLLENEQIFVDIDGEVRTKIGDGVSKYSQLKFTDEPLREIVDSHAKIYMASTKPDSVTSKDIWLKIIQA